MIDDMSDEAFWEFVDLESPKPNAASFASRELLPIWRECRRRAETLIEKTFQDGVRVGVEMSEVWTDREQVIETERRKAFEAGCFAVWKDDGVDLEENKDYARSWIDEAYRAYTEAAKDEKGAPKAEQPCWKCGATKEIR